MKQIIFMTMAVTATLALSEPQPLFPNAGLLRSDGNGNVTTDTTEYVPTSTTINGQQLTTNITIQGMTDNALVLTTNSLIETQSGDVVTPANLGAVANDSTYTTMAGKANSAVQPETLVQTVNTVKDLHWDSGLQVTWTSVVNNGHIYYIAVTNTDTSVAQ